MNADIQVLKAKVSKVQLCKACIRLFANHLSYRINIRRSEKKNAARNGVKSCLLVWPMIGRREV